jgi:hypothetical protein
MQGQIIPRGKRTWRVRIFLGRDANGKRTWHSHTVHGGKKDAQRYLNDKLRSRDLGELVQPARTTLNSHLDKWLEVKAPTLGARTREFHRWLLDHYVRPELGGLRPDRVNTASIAAVYAGMLQRGLNPSTVRRTHDALSGALGQAVRWRMIPSNPAALVELPKKLHREMNALDRDDSRRLLVRGSVDAASCDRQARGDSIGRRVAPRLAAWSCRRMAGKVHPSWPY